MAFEASSCPLCRRPSSTRGSNALLKSLHGCLQLSKLLQDVDRGRVRRCPIRIPPKIPQVLECPAPRHQSLRRLSPAAASLPSPITIPPESSITPVVRAALRKATSTSTARPAESTRSVAIHTEQVFLSLLLSDAEILDIDVGVRGVDGQHSRCARYAHLPSLPLATPGRESPV